MSLEFNGTDITDVDFNGTALDFVHMNGVEVWKRRLSEIVGKQIADNTDGYQTMYLSDIAGVEVGDLAIVFYGRDGSGSIISDDGTWTEVIFHNGDPGYNMLTKTVTNPSTDYFKSDTSNTRHAALMFVLRGVEYTSNTTAESGSGTQVAMSSANGLKGDIVLFATVLDDRNETASWNPDTYGHITNNGDASNGSSVSLSVGGELLSADGASSTPTVTWSGSDRLLKSTVLFSAI